MGSVAFLKDDTAVSPVIGIVLLVGISVMTMALVGTVVLNQGGFVQTTPDVDVGYNQTDDDVSVVVTSLIGTSSVEASAIDVRIDGDDACGTWDGDDELEVGDSLEITGYGDSCTDIVESDSITVVVDHGAQSELVSSYEPDFPGFELTLDGYDNEVSPDESVTFDVTVTNEGTDTDEQPIELEIRNRGTGASDVVADTELELDSGESETIGLVWDADDGLEGEDREDKRSYSAAVSSDDDRLTGSVVRVDDETDGGSSGKSGDDSGDVVGDDSDENSDEEVVFESLVVDVHEYEDNTGGEDDEVRVVFEYKLNGPIGENEIAIAAEVDNFEDEAKAELSDTTGTVTRDLKVRNKNDAVIVSGVINGEACNTATIDVESSETVC